MCTFHLEILMRYMSIVLLAMPGCFHGPSSQPLVPTVTGLTFTQGFMARNIDMGDDGHITGFIEELELQLEVRNGEVIEPESSMKLTPGPHGISIVGLWLGTKQSKKLTGQAEWQPTKFQPDDTGSVGPEECFTITLESTNPEVDLLARLWGGLHQREVLIALSVLGEIEASAWLSATEATRTDDRFNGVERLCQSPFHVFPGEQ